jgi:hypothetical protein
VVFHRVSHRDFEPSGTQFALIVDAGAHPRLLGKQFTFTCNAHQHSISRFWWTPISEETYVIATVMKS